MDGVEKIAMMAFSGVCYSAGAFLVIVIGVIQFIPAAKDFHFSEGDGFIMALLFSLGIVFFFNGIRIFRKYSKV